MTDLIIFAVLIVWLIYLRVRNARQADNHKDARLFYSSNYFSDPLFYS